MTYALTPAMQKGLKTSPYARELSDKLYKQQSALPVLG